MFKEAAQTVKVSAPTFLTYDLTPDDDWITVWDETTRSGTNDVYFSVDGLSVNDSRIGVLYVGNTPVYVCQSGFEALVETTAVEESRFASTGMVSFVIGEEDNENRWTALPTEDWITLSKYTGIGDGKLRYACEANTTGVTRVGRILFCDQIVTVTQYG